MAVIDASSHVPMGVIALYPFALALPVGKR
jgi:hypothetical protein